MRGPSGNVYGRPRKYRIIYPNVEAWLAKPGNSMSKLGELSGVHPAELSRVFYGFISPGKSVIDRILKGLEMTYEEAFYEPD